MGDGQELIQATRRGWHQESLREEGDLDRGRGVSQGEKLQISLGNSD